MTDMPDTLSTWLEAKSIRAGCGGQKIRLPSLVSPAQTVAAATAADEASEQLPKSDDALPGFVRYEGAERLSLGGDRIQVTLPGVQAGETLSPDKFDELRRREEAVEEGERRIHAALGGVVAADPEGHAALQRTNERLKKELEGAYAEVAALRRATAGAGRGLGANYYEKMGRAMELDADNILDLLDRHQGELPAAMASYLQDHARNISSFALNALAYAQTLN